MPLVTNCRLTQLSGKQKSIKVILGSQTDFFKARAGKTTGVEVPITDNQEEDFLRMCFFLHARYVTQIVIAMNLTLYHRKTLHESICDSLNRTVSGNFSM